jgi:hypothetical protein
MGLFINSMKMNKKTTAAFFVFLGLLVFSIYSLLTNKKTVIENGVEKKVTKGKEAWGPALLVISAMGVTGTVIQLKQY